MWGQRGKEEKEGEEREENPEWAGLALWGIWKMKNSSSETPENQTQAQSHFCPFVVTSCDNGWSDFHRI